MRRPMLKVAPIVAWLIVGLLAAPATAGWWDDLDKGRAVSLRDVIAQPARYGDGLLTFFCVFHRRDNVFNPLATPFHPSRHSNVSVWADGAPVWEEEAFKHDFPYLYIERRHPQHDALLATELFTRLEMTVRLKARLRGTPCLEIVSFRRTSQRLGRLAVDSLNRGDSYAEMGNADLAYENYKRALRPDLPPAYRLLLEKRVGEALMRLGRVAEARALVGSSEILAASSAPLPPVTSPVAPMPRPGPLPRPGPAPLPGNDIATGQMPEPGMAPSPLTSDLPGQPAAPSPTEPPPRPCDVPLYRPPVVGPGMPTPVAPPSAVTSDLPGQPVGAPPEKAEAKKEGEEEEAPEVPPAPPGKAPGAPPRRSPRMTGVR